MTKESLEPTTKIREIGIGILGYGFMGRSHSNAYKRIPYTFWPPPAKPKLVAVCGRNEKRATEEAQRFGYSRYYTDWRKMLRDREVQLFDNSGTTNIHAEPCIYAAEEGMDVFCEKPMAMSAKEAKKMLRAIEKAGVKNMVGFNYRFVPALQLARKMISEGTIGKLYHFHGRYYQDWLLDPTFPYVWRLDKDVAGTGAVGEMGSHITDLAHFLVGDLRSVKGSMKTFITERPLGDSPEKKIRVEIDDAFDALVEFKNGATGTFSCSRFCAGRKNYMFLEIYGSEGSIAFDLENLNKLRVHLRNHVPRDLEPSFHETLVTEEYHPYMKHWWPPGHLIGWEHAQVHELHHFLNAIVYDKEVAPLGATFADGYKCDVVTDAILRSAKINRRIFIEY